MSTPTRCVNALLSEGLGLVLQIYRIGRVTLYYKVNKRRALVSYIGSQPWQICTRQRGSSDMHAFIPKYRLINVLSEN